MTFLFKLGLYTCLFYVVLTAVIEAAVLFRGVGIFVLRGSGRHLFWTAGASLGSFFAALWVVSFFAAWCIVYPGLKSAVESIGR